MFWADSEFSLKSLYITVTNNMSQFYIVFIVVLQFGWKLKQIDEVFFSGSFSSVNDWDNNLWIIYMSNHIFNIAFFFENFELRVIWRVIWTFLNEILVDFLLVTKFLPFRLDELDDNTYIVILSRVFQCICQ